jgi:hypothetical protein
LRNRDDRRVPWYRKKFLSRLSTKFVGVSARFAPQRLVH